MTDLSRRGALGLFAAALAAPAIIRTPGLLMPVVPPLIPVRLYTYRREGQGPLRETLTSPVVVNHDGMRFQTAYPNDGEYQHYEGSLYPRVFPCGPPEQLRLGPAWRLEVSTRYTRKPQKVWVREQLA